MAIDPRYIPSIAFEQYMVDNATGLPLAGGYMEFYSDNDRITPKLVYQISGDPPNYTYIALPNPLSLSDVGTPINNDGNPVNVYAFPYDSNNEVENYYIKVYNSSAELQFVWSAWPNVSEADNPTTLLSGYQNQLSNPQFIDVNFIPNEGMTITFDGVLSQEEYIIAPGWSIIISSSGAGTLTLEKISIEGSLNIATNPPYFLSILPTGANITEVILRQTLANNPDIWSTTSLEDGYVSSCMLITSYDNQNHTLEMQYKQSAGATDPIVLVSGDTSTEGYQFLNATVLLPAGTNPENSDDGSIFIDIILPNIGHYGVTSLQVVGLGQDNVTVDFQQETANRQRAQLFYYYKPQIDYKPIKSYLCAWDFSLNPAQSSGSSVTLGSYASGYLWDQTIGWQSTISSMAVTRATGLNSGSLSISAVASSKFAIIQYLTVPEIIDILNNPISSNIVLSCNQANLVGTISLWYTSDLTLPNINSQHESLVLTLDDNGKPATLNGNWIEVDRNNYGDAIFTLNGSVSLDDLQSFGFSGWQCDGDLDIGDVTYFAIVVGFEELETGNDIVIQSCSLVPGYVPTIPSPQTKNEVLMDCQYYYQKTYEDSNIHGTITTDNEAYYDMPCVFTSGPSTINMYPGLFIIEHSTMLSNPLLTFYSPSAGTADHVDTRMYNNSGITISTITFSTNWSSYTDGLNRQIYIPSSTSSISSFSGGGVNVSGGITAQITFDSRLGIY